MATRTVVTSQPGGKSVVEQRPLTLEEQARFERLAASETGSSSLGNKYESPFARQHRELLQASLVPRIETVTIEGYPVPFHIRRGGLGELSAHSAWSSRGRNGQLLITDSPSLQYVSYAAALMFVYLAAGENDEASLFGDWPEAYNFADSRDEKQIKVVDALTERIVALNPLLVPDALKPSADELKAEREQEKKDLSGAKASEPSLTPPVTTPLNGLNATATTAAPAVWQSDRGTSTSTIEATPQPSNA